jgi:hypothetical protein
MKHNDINHHLLYEVRLIVGITDYGTSSTLPRYSALDTILPLLENDCELVVLGHHEQHLKLSEVAETTIVVASTTTSTTVPTATASRKARTLQDVPNGHQRWTKAERKELLRLSYQGISNAEIAKKLGRTEKAVALQIWHMEKGN